MPPLPNQSLLVFHTESPTGGQRILQNSLGATHRDGSSLIQGLLQGQMVLPGKAPAGGVGSYFKGTNPS